MRKGDKVYFDTYECNKCGKEFEKEGSGNNEKCPSCGGTGTNQTQG